MTNIILSGCNGKMGQVIARLLSEDNSARVIFGYDINKEMKNSFPVFSDFGETELGGDVVIDFSHPSSFSSVTKYCRETKTPLVMTTTGLSDEQKDELLSLSKEVAVFFSANMSIGVNLLVNLVKKATAILGDAFDIEIIEKHHNLKIDAPSGTALMIADEISSVTQYSPEYVYDRHSVRKKRTSHEIGIHAVRGGTIVGEHDVIFAGNDEIIEIKHTATSKEIFATGSIRAAKFIKDAKPGMYNMSNLIAGALISHKTKYIFIFLNRQT